MKRLTIKTKDGYERQSIRTKNGFTNVPAVVSAQKQIVVMSFTTIDWIIVMVVVRGWIGVMKNE